jgi:hypothetical protein
MKFEKERERKWCTVLGRVVSPRPRLLAQPSRENGPDGWHHMGASTGNHRAPDAGGGAAEAGSPAACGRRGRRGEHHRGKGYPPGNPRGGEAHRGG